MEIKRYYYHSKKYNNEHLNVTQDDFDIGYVYSVGNEKQFYEVLHELINWMNDLEHGVCSWDEFIDDIEGFPPDCGCKRERW